MDTEVKAIFLDRDGVINYDYGYVHSISNFVLIESFVEGCIRIQNLGFQIFVVTNQSGIGRGYFSQRQYQLLTDYYVRQLSVLGVNIIDVMHCSHHPDDKCECRKPKSYMVDHLCTKYGLNRSKSAMVGDKISDINCAIGAKLKYKFFIESKETPLIEDKNFYVVSNMLEVADFFDKLKY